MKKAGSRIQQPRPLAEIRKPIHIRAYRGRFKPFEATRYLDVKALRSAKSATIECGTVEAFGLKQTVAAEIRDGKVVALKPVACEGCAPANTPRVISRSERTAAMRALHQKLLDNRAYGPRKPYPVKASRRLGFQIPIGPIIIVIGEPPIGIDICIETWDGRQLCWYCLFGPSGCVTFGEPF